eukprot:2719631-Pleurochrysis_carterae.AAC.1
MHSVAILPSSKAAELVHVRLKPRLKVPNAVKLAYLNDGVLHKNLPVHGQQKNAALSYHVPQWKKSGYMSRGVLAY